MKTILKLFLTGSILIVSINVPALEIKDIRKICAGVSAGTEDVRSKYLDYIYKTYSVPFDFIYSQGDLDKLLSYCFTPEKINAKHCEVIKTMRSKIFDLLQDGFIGPRTSLLLNTKVNDPSKANALSFLNPSSDKYKLYCRESYPKKKKDPTRAPGLSLNWKTLSIAKDSSTINKKLSKKESAEFGIKLDRGTKEPIKDANDVETLIYKDVISANVTLALTDFIKFTPTPEQKETQLAPGPSLTPYISLAYESNHDPLKEKDNLSVGVVWQQYFSQRHYKSKGSDEPIKSVGQDLTLNEDYSRFLFELDRVLLKGEYTTDIEERQSQQWTSQISLPFISYDLSYFNPTRPYFTGYISADLILDHSKIARAGDKKALIKLTEEQGVKSYTRLGYDIRFDTAMKVDDGWTIAFGGKYQYRDATKTSGLGDVDRIELSLDFLPREESNISFGLTYERGDDLISLDEEELLKFGIKYKQ